jgi:hypothetical protein
MGKGRNGKQTSQGYVDALIELFEELPVRMPVGANAGKAIFKLQFGERYRVVPNLHRHF